MGVPPREGHHLIVQSSQSAGADDIRVGDAGTVETNVLGDRPVDQHRVLRYERHLARPIRVSQRTDVAARREDTTGHRVAQTQEQLDESGLATARRADDTDQFVRPDLGGDVGKHRLTFNVVERHTLENERTNGRDRIAMIDEHIRRVAIDLVQHIAHLRQ